MSKLSFRARALDASKPMPIYMAEELPDLPDYSAINRAVPQMPSGMEKEEECEHHLQRAICAGLIIPTPEVSDIPDKDVHDKLYPANYKQPRQLIHMQPFTMEQDIPDYDMDSEDERWLDMQAMKLDLNPLKFEEMMDRLEKSSGQTVVKLPEAKALLKEDDDLIIAVFDYWLNKRLKLQHPLILAVKTEHRVGTAVNNPYLAFRRRTEKMQTRKNRKNDETSYEKMLKLRRDLTRAVTLLELVKRREKMKREYLHLTVEVFEKRYQARDFSGAVAAEVLALKTSRPAFTPIFHNHYPNPSWPNRTIVKDEVIPRKEKRQYRKRKHKSSRIGGISSTVLDGVGGISSDEEPTATASPEPENVEDEGQFAFRRNEHCSYHMPLPAEGNWPWCSKDDNGLADKKYRYAYTSLLHPRKCIGLARRRLGRGGRVILDRLSRDIDDFWTTMDYTVYDSTSTQQQNSSLQTNSYNNLDVDKVARTQIKSEPSTVRTCDGVVSEVVVGGEVTPVAVKQEPDDINVGVCNTASAQPVQQRQALPSKEDREEMLEILQSVRRDWLHFRPKTPPPDYSPPCNMLPADEEIFDPCANMPFSLELKSIDETDIFKGSVYISSPFLLDYDISMEVPVTDTRQPSTANHQQHDDSFNTLTGSPVRYDDGAIGCSRFSVSDGAGAKTPALKRQCIVASTLTSPKLNNVLSDIRPRTHYTHTTSTVDTPISTANGIVSQYGIEGGNRSRNNKLPQYGYSRAVGHASAVNNIFSVHTSAPAVTLNSANILEIPISNDTDTVSAKGVVVSQCEPGSQSPNSKTKTIVRKNNLAMEVT